jgi:hypothetical protein
LGDAGEIYRNERYWENQSSYREIRRRYRCPRVGHPRETQGDL